MRGKKTVYIKILGVYNPIKAYLQKKWKRQSEKEEREREKKREQISEEIK